MNEPTLRLWHRRVGVLVAVFMALQGLSGLYLAYVAVSGHMLDQLVAWAMDLHLGGATAGHLYRILLGLGQVWMAVSGLLIYRLIRRRMAAAAKPKPRPTQGPA